VTNPLAILFLSRERPERLPALQRARPGLGAMFGGEVSRRKMGKVLPGNFVDRRSRRGREARVGGCFSNGRFGGIENVGNASAIFVVLRPQFTAMVLDVTQSSEHVGRGLQ